MLTCEDGTKNMSRLFGSRSTLFRTQQKTVSKRFRLRLWLCAGTREVDTA